MIGHQPSEPAETRCQKRSSVALLAAALLLATSGTLLAQGPPPPAALDRPGSPEPPSWVSLALAQKEGTTQQGAEVLFAPETRAVLGRFFDAPPVHGCYELGPDIYDRVGAPAPPRTLEEAARQKPVLLVGKVLETTPGFDIGTVGNLVRAEAEAGSRSMTSSTEVLFSVPIGEPTFRGKRLCKADVRFAGLAAVGDEVLVFADRLAPVRMLHPPVDRPQDLALPDLQGKAATSLPIYPDDRVILPAGAGATVEYPLAWRQQETAAQDLPRTPAAVLALVPDLPAPDPGVPR